MPVVESVVPPTECRPRLSAYLLLVTGEVSEVPLAGVRVLGVVLETAWLLGKTGVERGTAPVCGVPGVESVRRFFARY